MLSAATMLAIGTSPPKSGTTGNAVTPSLTVDIEDSSGHIVTTDSSTVTLTVATGPGGFASGSTASVKAVNGIATFSTLIFDTSGNYTLGASDGSLTKATSGKLNITPATAAKLAIQQRRPVARPGKLSLSQ